MENSMMSVTSVKGQQAYKYFLSLIALPCENNADIHIHCEMDE